MEEKLNVRMSNPKDYPLIASYFTTKPHEYWTNMGVDVKKLPKYDFWIKFLTEEFNKSIKLKKSLYYIWEYNNIPIGHSNANSIVFGKKAEFHLHIWDHSHIKKGLGLQFLKLTIPLYFQSLKLNTLYCQPCSNNPAPNKALIKLGFELIKKYRPSPVGWIHLDVEMSRYRLQKEQFDKLEWSQIMNNK